MEDVRRATAESVANAQQRNRRWWEALPMTYAPWEVQDRTAVHERLPETFLASNPWLRGYDFSPAAGEPVLDLGSGAGPAAALFGRAGSTVVAADLTTQGTRLTAATLAAHGFPIRVVQGDAERLPFRSAAFGRVFSWGVLHHSASTESAVGEVARVLKPWGRFLVMVYHRNSVRYWIRGLQWLLFRGKLLAGDTLETVQRYYTDGFFHRHFSGAELEALLRRYGLSPERVTATHMSRPFTRISSLDSWIVRMWGWLLVAEARKD